MTETPRADLALLVHQLRVLHFARVLDLVVRVVVLRRRRVVRRRRRERVVGALVAVQQRLPVTQLISAGKVRAVVILCEIRTTEVEPKIEASYDDREQRTFGSEPTSLNTAASPLIVTVPKTVTLR